MLPAPGDPSRYEEDWIVIDWLDYSTRSAFTYNTFDFSKRLLIPLDVL